MGNGIENWKNLEYIHLSHAHMPTWPVNFNQLNKIAYLKIWDIFYLDDFPPNLCNMHNLRALNVHQAPLSSTETKIRTLPQCVVNLQNLQSVVFYFVLIDKFPIELFTMPNIEEIGFIVSNISGNSFNYTNSNKQSWDMEWNPADDTSYYLLGAPLCRTFDDGNYTRLPDKLIEFLNDVDACKTACHGETWHLFTCTPLDWQNGVCDDECNNADCLYDGGIAINSVMCITQIAVCILCLIMGYVINNAITVYVLMIIINVLKMMILYLICPKFSQRMKHFNL